MSRALLAPLAALALSGCSVILGAIFGGESGMAVGAQAGSISVGSTVSGDSRTGADRFTPTCGSASGSPEQVWTFVPPVTATYQLIVDSTYDGVLAIYDSAGTQIICDDDDGSTRRSRVEQVLQAGVSYLVVVDGYHGQTGTYSLTTSMLGGAVDTTTTTITTPPTAPVAIALGQRVHATTSGGLDTRTPPCGSQAGSPDAVFSFTPPADGTYIVRVTSDYDGTLAVYDASAALVGCNDDDGSTRASRVSAVMSASSRYELVVDGYYGASGSFTIWVEGVTTTVGGTIAAGQIVSGSTIGAADSRTPGCGSQAGSGDQSWRFTPPVTATYRVHVDSDYDGVLAVYPVGASDPLLCNDDHGSTRQSEIESSLIGGQAYDVVVDGYYGQSGTYTLRIDMLAGSGGAVVTPPPTIVAMPENIEEMEARCAAATPLAIGHITGAIAASEAAAQLSCGNGAPGGDAVYRLEVAQQSALTVLATASFDLALELREGCSEHHAVVLCTDTGAGSAERLDATLAPGRTYYLVVDSPDPAGAGAFALDVALTP